MSGLGRRVEVDCPVCGQGLARPWLRQGRWRVVECCGCRLRLTWPRPPAQDLDALYASSAYYEERSMGASSTDAWRARAAEILGCLPGSPRKVVDIGAGEGHLVAGLRAIGLECEGVEPSPAGRRAARERHGIELMPLAPPGPFGAVTFVHSLEHVRDPLAALREAADLLEPRGHVFIEVPHAGSVEMWWPAWRRDILDLPFHLYHFVPDTLARLVAAAGLEPVSVRLFNSKAIERLLALRQPRAKAAAPSPAPTSAPAAAARPHHEPWRSRLLSWLRQRQPGWKFQLVAVKPGR